MQEQRTSNSVIEHTDDMVIHTDLYNRVSAEKMYLNVEMYITQLTFLTVIFLCWKKSFGLYHLDFQSTFFFSFDNDNRN